MMLKNKKGFSSILLNNIIDKVMRYPHYSLVKFLYPRMYRIDDIMEDQSCKFPKTSDASLMPQNIGLFNAKYQIYEKPILEPLMNDKINRESI